VSLDFVIEELEQRKLLAARTPRARFAIEVILHPKEPAMRTAFHVIELLENRTLLSHGLTGLLAIDLAADDTAAIRQPVFSTRSNGASHASQIPAFYDGQQITINIKEQNSSDSLIDHNKSINTIYAYADLDDDQPFDPVIDAIHGDGFNPLWQQVLIQFNQGFTPHQFTSEEDVLAARDAGEITLVTTDEVYICAVVGGSGHGA
jgi:hypothetical protein